MGDFRKHLELCSSGMMELSTYAGMDFCQDLPCILVLRGFFQNWVAIPAYMATYRLFLLFAEGSSDVAFCGSLGCCTIFL